MVLKFSIQSVLKLEDLLELVLEWQSSPNLSRSRAVESNSLPPLQNKEPIPIEGTTAEIFEWFGLSFPCDPSDLLT